VWTKTAGFVHTGQARKAEPAAILRLFCGFYTKKAPQAKTCRALEKLLKIT
jgi:hypothetical protein